MAQRDLDAIQAELNRLADHIEVMVSIRVEIDGERADHFWLDVLTDDENQGICSTIEDAIQEAIDTVYETLYDEVSSSLRDVDLDEDYDPDKGLEDDEVDRASELTEERERLLKELALVDAQIEDLNSTLIA